jgi:rhomboid family GlyGly-CTERM serine protease
LTEPAGRGWLALCSLLGVGALAGWALPATALDWQPTLVWREPWRWWTAAFVHWSALHLAANLAGCAALAVFGGAARLPRRATWAWALAWPLTHLALLAQPALAHYGGLSGLLHAGVAVAALALLAQSRRRRHIGMLVLAGLGLKLLLERPWSGPLTHPAGWDIAIAPSAHLAGVASGLACATLFGLARRPAATMAPR